MSTFYPKKDTQRAVSTDAVGANVVAAQMKHYALSDVAAASATSVLGATALTDEVQVVTAGITDPDVPRAVSVTGTGAAAVAASAEIGSGDNGSVTITDSVAGTAGNDKTVEVVVAETINAALAADITDGAVLVTLGTDNGDNATAQIGAGENGVITVTVDAAGTGGNAWTIAASVLVGLDQPMDAALVGTDITVHLGTDGAGDPDNAKNTAALIAAAIHALAGVSANASGTGATPITQAIAPVTFAGGGLNFGADASKNTATLVAAAVDALAGVAAVASGTGASALTAAEGPTDFTGGEGKNAGNVIIAGTNIADVAQVETIVLNGNATVAGVKAFKTVSAITLPVGDENDNVSIGVSAKLGLPDKLTHNTVGGVYLGTTLETNAPTVVVSSTVLAQNTVTLNSALDGSDVVIYYID